MGKFIILPVPSLFHCLKQEVEQHYMVIFVLGPPNVLLSLIKLEKWQHVDVE